MAGNQYAVEFKKEALRQVIEQTYSVSDVAKELEVSAQNLYKWLKAYSPNAPDQYEV